MADKKHWLDWLAVGISILSLTVATLPAYRTVLYQRDDIRLIVGDSLKVKRDKSALLLSQDQEFTFINSGNRQAVISEIYGELVLVLDPNAGCNNQFAKSIILNPTTQIVLKPGRSACAREGGAGISLGKGQGWFSFSRGQRKARFAVSCLHTDLRHDAG
jgi:hypothetical protein